MLTLLLIALLAQGPREVARDLGSDDYAKREAASRELEEMGTVAIPALEEATKSDDAEVRARAREIIGAIREVAAYGGRIDPKRVEEIDIALFQRVDPQGNHLEYAPQDEDLPCLFALLDHPSLAGESAGEGFDSRQIRINALMAIGRVTLTEANESRLARILCEALSIPADPQDELPAREFLALVRVSRALDRPGLRDPLRGRLLSGFETLSHSDEPQIREGTAEVLRSWGDAAAKGILERLLADSNPQVAHGALCALWAYDTKGLEPALRRHLRATLDESDRLFAAHLLARAGDFGGLAVLFRALAGDDLALRNDACRRLSELLHRPLASDDVSRADADALLSWWTEKGEIVHWDATLGRFVAR